MWIEILASAYLMTGVALAIGLLVCVVAPERVVRGLDGGLWDLAATFRKIAVRKPRAAAALTILMMISVTVAWPYLLLTKE